MASDVYTSGVVRIPKWLTMVKALRIVDAIEAWHSGVFPKWFKEGDTIERDVVWLQHQYEADGRFSEGSRGAKSKFILRAVNDE